MLFSEDRRPFAKTDSRRCSKCCVPEEVYVLPQELAGEVLALVNATGERVVYAGSHTIVFKNGQGATSNVTVDVH